MSSNLISVIFQLKEIHDKPHFHIFSAEFAYPKPIHTAIKGLKMLNKPRLLTLALLFHSASSWAMPMDYTFDVIFVTGPLSGQTETVFVTLDGVTGKGAESFSPTTGLQAFDFTFGSQTFNITDDIAFDVFPLIQLTEGTLATVIYQAAKATRASIRYVTSSAENTVIFDGFAFPISTGVVAPNTWGQEPSVVPSPTPLALIALGLVGIGRHRRKCVAHS